ncbi:1-phosphofructokinase family hexose kinase [Melioribacteraceae bacterium 4301-Me]|uniref:1-phosphofructokinase family hexose kinase n=1 Tax=Pyranulibacter aquaticus TaxID=3163344 RepID=UPI0035951218
MVLTVTLNPLLEKRLTFKSVTLGNTQRAKSIYFTAGGKGINVSRQLNCLNIPNHALTFLGGDTGKLLRKVLSNEKISFSFVPTKNETREAFLAVEEKIKRVSTFISPNNLITEAESNEFKNKLEKMIRNCSIVVFSGSSPCTQTDDIFSYGINLANQLDKISVLDTYGTHLQKCIDSAPTVIHNNITELENSLNIDLSNEQKKIDFLKFLYSKGIKLAFLTDGSNDVFAAKFDFHYKLSPPKIKLVDSTGSGDAFTAGVVFGLYHSFVFDDLLKIATSLGTANAVKIETCNSTVDEYENYIDLIQIKSVGKKMKIIDDTPNTIS